MVLHVGAWWDPKLDYPLFFNCVPWGKAHNTLIVLPTFVKETLRGFLLNAEVSDRKETASHEYCHCIVRA